MEKAKAASTGKKAQVNTRQKNGKALMESLTSNQIATILDILFSDKESHRFMDRFRKADADMAATIETILNAEALVDRNKNQTGAPLAPSKQRLLENWDSLWRKWNDCVYQVGDEHGKYAESENDWEPPFFDGSALAFDLEPIAEEMLPLIEAVFPLKDDPEMFSAALEEIEDNIHGYPEWMSVEDYDGCTLENNTTKCVLKWFWLAVQEESKPGAVFVSRVLDMEDDLKLVALDDQETIAFFSELPETARREVYLHLKAGKEKLYMESIHSKWHKIHHLFEKAFDPAKALETNKKYLADNWRYGLPLIQDALKRTDLKQAEAFLEKTFAALQRIGTDNPWQPENGLLKEMYYFSSKENNDHKEICALLEIWSQVAKQRGNNKRSAAVELQRVIYNSRDNWAEVIDNYNRLLEPDTEKVLEQLITQWQNETIQSSLERREPGKHEDTYIHWLLAAELNPKENAALFHEKMGKWLNEINQNGNVFDKRWRELARLTKDLPNERRIQEDFPFFTKTVLPNDYGDSDLTPSRRAALKKLNMDQQYPMIMKIWEKHLGRILPNPTLARASNYTPHAQWLKALHEISPARYARIIGEWRLIHKNRKNLWRDIQALKLPL